MNEMVEQALVDNLLENDTFFPHPEMHQHHHHILASDVILTVPGSTQSTTLNRNNSSISGLVSSGNGQASSLMNASRSSSTQIADQAVTTTTTTTSNDNSNRNELPVVVDPESMEPTPVLTSASPELSNNSINISIRFVNEKEMRVQAKPNDTILFLKK
jgi:hypothetical protein